MLNEVKNLVINEIEIVKLIQHDASYTINLN